MSLLNARPWYAEANSQRLVSVAFVAIALIAMMDAVFVPYVGLGYLYLLPLVIASAFLSRLQILIITVICASFAEGFSHLPDGPDRIIRGAFFLVVFAVVSFLVRDMVAYRRAAAHRLEELDNELSLLHSAEHNIELLINSSAVGILTVSPEGNIMTCNLAAHQIMAVDPGGLTGQPIAKFLPIEQLTGGSRTPVKCSGRTAQGQQFEARIWKSTFSNAHTTVTAVVIDASSEAISAN